MKAPEIRKELRLQYDALKGKESLEATRIKITILSELIRLLELESGKELKSNDKKT